MNELRQLVREALDRQRVEQHGCFVHNAAAVALLDFGADAVAAIENEVLTIVDDSRDADSIPRDLASVMVIYARLIRQLKLGDRCVVFLKRLPTNFRSVALGGVHVAWKNNHPKPGALPVVIHDYVEELSTTASAPEQRIARLTLRDCK